MLIKPRIALFWDYENCPIPHHHPDRFIKALRTFCHTQNVPYASLYVQPKNLPQKYSSLIKHIHPHLAIQFVPEIGKNAADYALIKGCEDLLMRNLKINHMIWLTGDGDFERLGKLCLFYNITITSIVQHANYSPEIRKISSQLFSRDYLQRNPTNWWTGCRGNNPEISRKFDPLKKRFIL